MHKFVVVVVALATSIFGLSANASAHGDGTYPLRRPIVAASASVVGPNKIFAVGAAHFCPNRSITITLSKGSRHYSKTTRPNAKGQAVVWFRSSNIKPGLYQVTAKQGPPCNKSASSIIRITGRPHGSGSSSGSCSTTAGTIGTRGSCDSGHSLGSSYPGSGVVAAIGDLQDGMDTRAAGVAANTLSVSGESEVTTESRDSNGLDARQLTAVVVVGGIGAIGVQTLRRRPRRPRRSTAG